MLRLLPLVTWRVRTYTTLLMATELTFGSIAALFGYTHHFITRTQYTELVTVVVLLAFVPTIIAQQFFRPKVVDVEVEEALGAEDISLIRRRRRRRGRVRSHHRGVKGGGQFGVHLRASGSLDVSGGTSNCSAPSR